MAAITAVIPRPTTYAGVWGWITTVDHKRIAVLYGTSALVLMLIAGIEAGVMRMQLAQPDSGIIGGDRYNQLFTMHAGNGVYGDYASRRSLLQFRGAAGDRRTRRSLPSLKRPELLAVLVWRASLSRQLPGR